MNSDDTSWLGEAAEVGPPGAPPPSDQQRRSEDDDLRESLAGLARLASNRLSLEDLLTRVATYAVRAIPGADGAGLTLLDEGRADTLVATATFVSQIDDIQYGIGQGPCITAAQEGRTVISGSLGGDPRWPRFGGRVARRGVHSVVSLPLIAPDVVVGAMNVYAHAKDAFDDRAAELGEVFAAPAAIAVQNAQVLAKAQRLAIQLQMALASSIGPWAS
jgi:GAF domain-containing protein